MDTAYRDHLARKEIENDRFWKRFGGKPDFTGKSVLDVGSGGGELCFHIASSGAGRVVGVDIIPGYVDNSRRNLSQHHAHLLDRVEFFCGGLADLPPEQFDFIVSKNSFEHISDVNAMLEQMKKRLKPGGRMYIGFGPLFRSMNGAHMERFLIPWGHLFIPMPLYLKITAFDRRHPMKSVSDFSLNRLRFDDFKRAFQNTGLQIRYFRTNQSDNPAIRLFGMLSKLPLMKDLFTNSIYCILEKDA